MAALPLLSLALLWAAVHDRRPRLGLARLSARGTLVIAYGLLNGLVLAICELASLDHHLTGTTVAAAWIAVTAVLAVIVGPRLHARRRLRAAAARGRTASVLDLLAGVVCLAYLVVLALVTGLYRPATGDSMTYHLARVEHWLQDGTVAPFATHFLPQIDLAPLHEYSMATLHLLADTDRFDGFVQLLAYVIGAVAVSEMARLLGGSRAVQVLAPLLAVTVPAAVLQASSTQNDLFAATIGTVLLVVLLAWDPSGPVVPRGALLGLCAALAILAKGLVAPSLGPVAVGLLVLAVGDEVRAHRRAGWLRLAGAAVVALAVAAGAAAPFVARNVDLFGSPNGADQDRLLVDDLTPASAAANTVRSVTANFRVGNGRSGPEHLLSEGALALGSDVFDLFDVEPDDERYSLSDSDAAFQPQDFHVYQRFSEHGSNPWHVVLISLSGLVLLVAYARRRVDERVLVLMVGLSVGFVLFASLVRWQIYGVRFQLASVLAWCPLVALVLSRWRRLAPVVVGGLVLASLPMLLRNGERPLLDAHPDPTAYMEPYFPSGRARDTTPDDYDAVAQVLTASSCRSLGLATRIPYEYPLWVGLHHHDWDGEVQSVGVTNESAELLTESFEPCATLRFVPLDQPPPPGGIQQLRFGELVLRFAPG